MGGNQASAPGTLLGSFLSSYSRSRRLEDRIRKLCAEAVTVTDSAELITILDELSSALREHMARIRKMASDRPNFRERRRVAFERQQLS